MGISTERVREYIFHFSANWFFHRCEKGMFLFWFRLAVILPWILLKTVQLILLTQLSRHVVLGHNPLPKTCFFHLWENNVFFSLKNYLWENNVFSHWKTTFEKMHSISFLARVNFADGLKLLRRKVKVGIIYMQVGTWA